MRVYLACVCALLLLRVCVCLTRACVCLTRACVCLTRACVCLTRACVCLSRACVWHSVNLRFEQQWGSKVCAQVIHSSPVCSPLLWVGVGVSTVWEGGEGEEQCLLGTCDSDSDAFEQWFILFCV